MEELHIGQMIKAELKAQERTVTWFAKHIHCDRTNVYRIFKNSNIDLRLHSRISVVLNYNFFKVCSDDFEKKHGMDSIQK